MTKLHIFLENILIATCFICMQHLNWDLYGRRLFFLRGADSTLWSDSLRECLMNGIEESVSPICNSVTCNAYRSIDKTCDVDIFAWLVLRI